jgi:hypothetical protein
MPLEHTPGDQHAVLVDGMHGFRAFPDQAIAVISRAPLQYLMVAGSRTHLMSGDSFERSEPIETALVPSGWEFELRPNLTDVSALPQTGKSVIVLGLVHNVLHIRIFDTIGNVVVDTEEGQPSQYKEQIGALKQFLIGGRSSFQLSSDERQWLIFTVMLLVGHAFRRDAVGQYDEHYAGIGSVYVHRDRQELLGFFHAELPTGGKDDAGTDCFYGTIALAVSKNGGRTFDKIDPIITGVPQAPGSTQTAQGVGDVSVWPDSTGKWLYAYYTEHSQIDRATGQRRPVVICMARSRILEGGRPGTWWKYFGDPFLDAEPGLRGKDKALVEGWAPNVQYLPHIEKYLMICCLHSRGIGFCESDDGTNWTDPTVIIPMETAPSKGKEIATHPSFYIRHQDEKHAEGYLLYGYTKCYGWESGRSPHYFVKKSLRFDLTS